MAILQKDSSIVECFFKYHKFFAEAENENNKVWYTLDLSKQGREIGSVLHLAACCVYRDTQSLLLNNHTTTIIKRLLDEGADPNESLPRLSPLTGGQDTNVLSILPPCTSADLIFDLLEGGCNPFIKTIHFCHENIVSQTDHDKFNLFQSFLRSWIDCECHKRSNRMSLNKKKLKLEVLCSLSRGRLDPRLVDNVRSLFFNKEAKFSSMETELHLACFKTVQESSENAICMAECMVRAFARKEYVLCTHEQLRTYLISQTETFVSQLQASGCRLCDHLPGGVLAQILECMSMTELRQFLLVNRKGYAILLHFIKLRQKISKRLLASEFRPFQARIERRREIA
uniref:F-box domain-containing protein n=1 Tax=Guillardia theta TaxID=55529 RepID=A0A6U5Z6L1_GUITH